MALTTLQNIKDTLKYGSRSNLFKTQFTIPPAITAVTTSAAFDGSDVLCKAAAIPAMTVGIIEVPFRGRRAKIPGDRTWTDWTATFYSDSAHKLRSAFIAWTNYIRTLNEASETPGNTGNYYGTIDLSHLTNSGSVSRVYKLESVFPTEVGAIDLSYDTTDAIEEFTVTFQYHYMTFAEPVLASSSNTATTIIATGPSGP